MKVKKIWSKDTAEKVAAAKFAKYGTVYEVVPMKGGGFEVKPAAGNATWFVTTITEDFEDRV